MSSRKANHLQQEVKSIFPDAKFNKGQIIFPSLNTLEQKRLAKEINNRIHFYLLDNIEGGYCRWSSKEIIKMKLRALANLLFFNENE